MNTFAYIWNSVSPPPTRTDIEIPLIWDSTLLNPTILDYVSLTENCGSAPRTFSKVSVPT